MSQNMRRGQWLHTYPAGTPLLAKLHCALHAWLSILQTSWYVVNAIRLARRFWQCCTAFCMHGWAFCKQAVTLWMACHARMCDFPVRSFLSNKQIVWCAWDSAHFAVWVDDDLCWNAGLISVDTCILIDIKINIIIVTRSRTCLVQMLFSYVWNVMHLLWLVCNIRTYQRLFTHCIWPSSNGSPAENTLYCLSYIGTP